MITSIAFSRQNTPAWWQWFNILSLDAPCVAMLWQFFFATAYRLHLPLSAYFLLGISVWWLYAFDRCADVLKHPELAKLTHRHAFYRQHHKLFTYAVLPISAISIVTAALYHLPQEIFLKSLGLAFCVGIYFLAYVIKGRSWFSVILCGLLAFTTVCVLAILPLPLAPKIILGTLICSLLLISGLGLMPTQVAIPKEFVAAYLFSIGTLLHLGIYLKSGTLHLLTEPTVIFALLCFLNLLAISRADRQVDEVAHQRHQLAIKNQSWMFGLACFGVLLGCWALSSPFRPLHVPFIVAYLGSVICLATTYLRATRMGAEITHLCSDLSLVLGASAGLLAAFWMA